MSSARVEEEGQVDAGRDQDEERVEGDLAEEERPVIWKHVAERLLEQRCGSGALVEVADEPADHGRHLSFSDMSEGQARVCP
jgi:hypothetical protein